MRRPRITSFERHHRWQRRGVSEASGMRICFFACLERTIQPRQESGAMSNRSSFLLTSIPGFGCSARNPSAAKTLPTAPLAFDSCMTRVPWLAALKGNSPRMHVERQCCFIPVFVPWKTLVAIVCCSLSPLPVVALPLRVEIRIVRSIQRASSTQKAPVELGKKSNRAPLLGAKNLLHGPLKIWF